MKISRSKPIPLFFDDESVESILYKKGIGPTPADLKDKFIQCGLSSMTPGEQELLNRIISHNDCQ